MKKTYYIILMMIGVMTFLAGCADHLKSDYLFNDRISTEDIFKSKDYSEEWLAHAYGFLGADQMADVSSKGHTPFCFADDMYFGDREDKYKEWKNGEYNEDGVFGVGSGLWRNAYQGIRQTSIYLKNIDMNQEMTEKEIATRKAEAHFLRAMFYWKLIRLFGPVPLLPDEGLDYTQSYDNLALPRNTYEECVEFIVSELEIAAQHLDLRTGSNNVARPTIGAALALRARVLLYAASPLMNGGGSVAADYVAEIQDDKGRNLMPMTNDNAKWARAAAAARDVMELEGGSRYQLHHTLEIVEGTPERPKTIVPPADGDFSEQGWPNGWKGIDPQMSYRDIFNGTVPASSNVELIFTRGNNQVREGVNVMVLHQLPRIATGWNTHGMTQKQCDAYYMANGSDVPGKDKEIGRGDGSERVTGFVTEDDVNNGKYRPLSKDVSLQYANREPRFYASVAYNGSVWHMLNESKVENQRKQVFYYRGGGNGYTNTMFWLRTGIGVMKYVHPNDTHEGRPDKLNKIEFKAEPSIRYAEILLIYAEAINELNGSYTIESWDKKSNYTLSRDVNEMKKGVRPIRIRAGVPDYTSGEYADQSTLRNKLKRERQIEFMGEGHRYYDLRRWLDAPVEESLPIYGCNVLATGRTDDQKRMFHTPVVVPSLPTTFSRKMWFWPINHTELKRNKRLTQNPGWTYPN